MSACEWARRGLVGKDKVNSSYHDFPCPHLRDGILSKVLDRWMCGVGELRQLTTSHWLTCQCLSPPFVISTAHFWPGFQSSGRLCQPGLLHLRKGKKAETHQLFPASWHKPTWGGTECQPDHYMDEKKLMINVFCGVSRMSKTGFETSLFWLLMHLSF